MQRFPRPAGRHPNPRWGNSRTHLVKGIPEPGSAFTIEIDHPIMGQWWSDAYLLRFSGSIIALAQ
jgi:hypothetical protein